MDKYTSNHMLIKVWEEITYLFLNFNYWNLEMYK